VLRDLMARMGHDSERAAMIYQHEARGADKAITDAIDKHVDNERGQDDDGGKMARQGCSCPPANKECRHRKDQVRRIEADAPNLVECATERLGGNRLASLPPRPTEHTGGRLRASSSSLPAPSALFLGRLVSSLTSSRYFRG
jgi:hypothetical protein